MTGLSGSSPDGRRCDKRDKWTPGKGQNCVLENFWFKDNECLERVRRMTTTLVKGLGWARSAVPILSAWRKYNALLTQAHILTTCPYRL